MEENKKIGNAKLLIVSFVLTVAIIFGSTYAWLRLTKSSNTVNKITAGNLELVLDDTTSEGINLEKAVPISDAEGEKGTEYTFTLENKGTVDLNYYLYLNDVDLAEGETRLEDNKVRYKLVKDDNVVTATNVGIYRIVFVEGNYTLDFDPQTHRFSSAVQSNGDTVTGLADHLNSQLSENATFNDGYQVVKKTFGSSNTYKIIRERNSKLISSMKKNNDNKILDKGQIDSKQKITYKLQIWIDKDAETEVMGKIFNARLSIEATQTTTQVQILSFADDSWSTIATNVKAGKASAYQVGDTKTVDMGELGIHTLRVANTSDCTNRETSETACGFVVEFADIISKQSMNSIGTNVGGWPASEMRTYVNSTVYNALPSELQNVIATTTVVSGHGSTSGESNFTSNDKLYLLSTKEVWGKDGISNTINYDTAEKETRQLDYYKNKGVTTSNYSEAIKPYNGSNDNWWLRSAYIDNSFASSAFFAVRNNGGWTYFSIVTIGVAPAFRIA